MLMNRLANFISYLLHPVYMPTIGMYIALNYGIGISLRAPYKWYVCVVTFVFTCVFPVFTIVTLKSLKAVTSIHLPTKEERRLPILMSAGFFFMAYYLVKSVHVIDLLDYIMISGAFTMISLSMVNFFYKLSIHMAAAGSVTGMLTALSVFPGTHLGYFIAGSIAAAGVIGFARLQLKAHSAGEVVIGYFTGFAAQYFVLRLLTF